MIRTCVKCVQEKETTGRCVPLCAECREFISKRPDIIDEVNGLCSCEKKEEF